MNILVITDHTSHSQGDSFYRMLSSLNERSEVGRIDVLSRGIEINQAFFQGVPEVPLQVSTIGSEGLKFEDGASFFADHHEAPEDYGAVLIRIDVPYSPELASAIQSRFHQAVIINRPLEILITGQKDFLLNFKDICPPMTLCDSIDAVQSFREEREIVLKPVVGYGGKGLLRLSGDQCFRESKLVKEEEMFRFLKKQFASGQRYLAMEFLPRITEGDLRVLVTKGEVLGSVLRVPAKDSWLGNMAMGATTRAAKVTEQQLHIVERVDAVLQERGIVIYGIDLIEKAPGERVLSEINTLNVGGFIQADDVSGNDSIERCSDLLIEYIQENR